MYNYNRSLLLLLGIHFSACTLAQKNNPSPHADICNDEKPCTCQIQYNYEDSGKLILIKNQFYQNKEGHKYELTIYQREGDYPDSLQWVKYFNGCIPQDVDLLTFTQLDGWFAKDKNQVYYYRPHKGGMQITPIEKADIKTFAVLQGHWKYAKDKNHVFYESSILKNLKPRNLKITKDACGHIEKFQSGKYKLVLDDFDYSKHVED